MADDNNGGNPELEQSEEDSSSPLSKLRRRWELASVLNFFSVFEPLIKKDYKELNMSAEEIEDALINPNASLAKLHISLLKGIPSVSKRLSEPDFWITNLCKKLVDWWPWVAEGNIPLVAGKGEEVSSYKELDPTIRLLMLKALCELRALQDDLVSYVNDELKEEGAQVSRFRKDKIGQDRNGVSYWYDGNPVVGYRLYREVDSGVLMQKHRGNNCLDLKETTNSEWEIIATNLDEFRRVSERFSSCQVGAEAAVHETIETEVIPVLEKLQKKKERDLKRRQREEAYVSGGHSYVAGVTRSCRMRRPVKYTFDEFDRTIEEAIKETRKGKVRKVERKDTKHFKHGESGGGSDGDSQNDAHAEEESPASTSKNRQNDRQGEGDSDYEEVDQSSKGSDNDEEDDQQGEGSENDEDGEHGEGSENDDGQHGEGSEDDVEDDLQSEGSDKGKDTNCTDNTAKSYNQLVSDSESDSSDLEHENVTLDGKKHLKALLQGQKDSVATGLQIKRNSDRTSGQNLHEGRNPEAKNRYRQRPTLNSALDSFVVPDSEDESSPENSNGDASSEGDPSEVADSEDENSS